MPAKKYDEFIQSHRETTIATIELHQFCSFCLQFLIPWWFIFACNIFVEKSMIWMFLFKFFQFFHFLQIFPIQLNFLDSLKLLSVHLDCWSEHLNKGFVPVVSFFLASRSIWLDDLYNLNNLNVIVILLSMLVVLAVFWGLL